MSTILLRQLASATLTFLLFCQLSFGQQPTSKPYYADPAISPDASEIAFNSGGDIWTVSSSGGEARLLVAHPDFESRPLYAPDGKWLAFISTRSGNGDIYLLNLSTTQLTRLTYDDAPDELSAWSADGQYIYFSTAGHDIAGMRDVYRVSTKGGTPMPIANDRYVSEFFASPSPDGSMLAMTAHGISSTQWWRNGHSHLDEGEIWLMQNGKTKSFEKLTESGAKYMWPMWSRDGGSLYYVSDKTGIQNLYSQSLQGAPKQLTQYTNGRVLWPSIAFNGKTIAFERDFNIYTFDIATGQAKPVVITLKGAAATPATQQIKITNQFREVAISPDGKKVAVIARGEVYVASAKDGGDATRVTKTTGMESQLVWHPNSNSILYSSDRNGAKQFYQYNFIIQAETQLTATNEDDYAPIFSPDGKQLAFVRNGKQVMVMDMATKKESRVTTGFIGRPIFPGNHILTWSPDGKMLAFTGYGSKAFSNIYVAPATGGEARAISFFANSFTDNVQWSKDGKYILFTTGQRTENTIVARVDLVVQQPKFIEQQFQNLFTEDAPGIPRQTLTPGKSTAASVATDSLFKNTKTTADKAVTKIVYEGLKQRTTKLPVDIDVDEIVLSPDGKNLLLIGSLGGQQNIYSYSMDDQATEPAVLKQITSTASGKSGIQFSSDGKEVYFIEQGKIAVINMDNKQVKPLGIAAEMAIDFNQEKGEVFKQVWSLQKKGFYDEKYHGTDWNKIKTLYEPLANGANTPDELRRILALMVGELNASHSGVSGGAPQLVTGRIGLEYNTDAFEKNGKLKIEHIVAGSPAAVSGEIHTGDYVLAIDGNPVTASTNVDQLLENRINKRVTLSVASGATGASRMVSLKPVNYTTEKDLLYKQWVDERRAYVHKVSNGRLGYLHMFDMGQESLQQLYMDADADNQAKDGVVVDVRNNNGGFVNAYALDVLSRKGYMSMTIRGLPTAPARNQLGQRALDLPTILVTNQHSLSDAEDFSEGYQTLKLGKVVGEPTGGWIIYTSNIPMFDGTNVRLPFIKVTDHAGKNMEMVPRSVDIAISNPLGEKEKDAQLDVAVKELLKQIDSKAGR